MHRFLTTLSLLLVALPLIAQNLPETPPTQQEAAKPQSSTWSIHADAQLGFSVLMPPGLKPEFEPHENDNGSGQFGATTYSYSDPKTHLDFRLRLNSLPPHHYFPFASSLYTDELIAQGPANRYLFKEAKDITLQGIKGKHLIFQTMMGGGPIELLVFLRANRLYSFRATCYYAHHFNKAAQERMREVLTSFRLLPLAHTPLQTDFYRPGFFARFPATPIQKQEEEENVWLEWGADSVNVWEARDTTTGFSYTISQAYFPDWTRILSWEEILKTVPENLIEQSPFTATHFTTLQNQIAYEAQSYREHGAVHQYIRTLVQGHHIFQVYCDVDSLQPAHAKTFLNTIHFTPMPAFDWASSKLAAILPALLSPDPATVSRALRALKRHPLTPDDLPLVTNHLRQRALAKDTSNAIPQIFEVLAAANFPAYLDSLDLLLPYFHYTPDFQAYSIVALLHHDTLHPISDVMAPLQKYRPHPQDSVYHVYLINALDAQLYYAEDPAHFFDQIAFFSEDPYFAQDFLKLTITLSYEADPERQHLRHYHPRLLALAQDWIDHPHYLHPQTKTLSAEYETLIQALSFAVPDQTIYDAIYRIMAMGDPRIEEYAVLHLLEHNLPLTQDHLIHLLEQPGYQLKLLQWLWENDQQKRVPSKYFKQDYLAPAIMLSTYRAQTHQVPTEVELLTKHTYKSGDDNDHLLYIYRVKTPTSPDWEIAFSGPFPKHGPLPHFSFYASGTNQDLWTSDSQAQLIKEWLEFH